MHASLEREGAERGRKLECTWEAADWEVRVAVMLVAGCMIGLQFNALFPKPLKIRTAMSLSASLTRWLHNQLHCTENGTASMHARVP